MISSLIFISFLIDTVGLCVYVNIGAGSGHCYDESYCQSFCLQ